MTLRVPLVAPRCLSPGHHPAAHGRLLEPVPLGALTPTGTQQLCVSACLPCEDSGSVMAKPHLS